MNKNTVVASAVAQRDERGMALLAVLMVVFLLSLLGMTSMQLAGQEMIGASALQQERTAHHAAEAAVDVVMGWFHDPALMPQGIEPAWLAKRATSSQGDPSYFDTQGRSQFAGTANRPDVMFDAANPQHDRLLNDPQTGWFKSLNGLAKFSNYGCMARPVQDFALHDRSDGGSRSGLSRIENIVDRTWDLCHSGSACAASKRHARKRVCSISVRFHPRSLGRHEGAWPSLFPSAR